MPTLKLWLIRHGESSVNTGIWSSNPAIAELTELGKKQAQEVAKHVIEPPQLIISSPFLRAQQTAQFIQQKWPTTPSCIWPIEEIIYLSPKKLQHLSAPEKNAQIAAYWKKSDPWYCDGDDAESFASFVQRLMLFREQISQQQGFIIAVGHAHFFKAFQLGIAYGFATSKEWMQFFRQQEVNAPIKNGEIIEITFND